MWDRVGWGERRFFFVMPGLLVLRVVGDEGTFVINLRQERRRRRRLPVLLKVLSTRVASAAAACQTSALFENEAAPW